ncbi:MAG: hypothetical protein HKP30_04450, partial [Myxococcales bacterium]|nr:hypothetical protein [Myxococcales bacterium]
MAAVGLALLTSGEAAAMAIPAGSEVPAECFSVEKRIETGQRNPDAVSGNYWERHDRFVFEANFDAGCDIDAYVSGISIVIKTPYQIDSTPDIDDLDDADDFSVLEGQMQSDFPEFIQTFGGGAMTDSTGTALPAVGPSGAFTGARVCINSSIAACTPANAIPLMEIGGGLM